MNNKTFLQYFAAAPNWHITNDNGVRPLRDLFSIMVEAATNPDQKLGLVYGFPKTGNSSCASTLGHINSINAVWSSHCISDKGIKSIQEICYKYDFNASQMHNVNVHIRDAFILQAFLKSTGFYYGYEHLKPIDLVDYKIPVICGLRDPVDLFISFIAYINSNNKSSSADLLENLNKAISSNADDIIFAQGKWLQEDLMQVTGFNAFDVPFDKNKGYIIFETQSFRILLIRSEWMNSILPAAIEELLGVKPSNIFTENQAAKRSDGAAYLSARASFSLSNSKIKNIYNDIFAKHFMTDDEISRKLN